MDDSLETLLQHCTVKIITPGGSGWGTGFFVAPGWILTCDHVVKGAANRAVQVQWQAQAPLGATVEKALPDPYDIALLRLEPGAAINSPCVYLDAEVKPGEHLYLFGYSDEGAGYGEPVTPDHEGLTGSKPPFIKFKAGQVRPGMSGAPLLNQRTGKVCGMVKFTRDRSIDLGGGAVLVSTILEQFPELSSLQYEFHRQDQTWIRILESGLNECTENFSHTLSSDLDVSPRIQHVITANTVQIFNSSNIPSDIKHRETLDLNGVDLKSKDILSPNLNISYERDPDLSTCQEEISEAKRILYSRFKASQEGRVMFDKDEIRRVIKCLSTVDKLLFEILDREI